MKKYLSLLLVVTIILSGFSISFAETQNEKEIVTNQPIETDEAIVEKYAKEYDALEYEAETLIRYEELQKEEEETDKVKNDLKLLTKTIEEGDEVVTIGIVYSKNVTQNIPTQLISTHAKLYINSTLSKRTAGNDNYYSLKKVSGRVVQFYDGATCSKIVVKSGQSMPGSTGDRTHSFTVTTSSYAKTYSWPEIKWYPGVSNIGHSATFYIKRGTVTTPVLVQANL